MFGAWMVVKVIRGWLADDAPRLCWICEKRTGREEGGCVVTAMRG